MMNAPLARTEAVLIVAEACSNISYTSWIKRERTIKITYLSKVQWGAYPHLMPPPNNCRYLDIILVVPVVAVELLAELVELVVRRIIVKNKKNVFTIVTIMIVRARVRAAERRSIVVIDRSMKK